MTIKIRIKPISEWIGAETEYPGRSQFRQTYSNTKKLLAAELEKLDAIDSTVQLEMFIRQDDLRLDGELRANVRPFRPGVVLSFSKVKRRVLDKTSRQWKNELQTLSYPCDSYDDWQDNLRAVALSLEALRKVARYGVFKYEDMLNRLALPTADEKLSDSDSAIDFLTRWTQWTADELKDAPVNQKSAYREAARFLHPDTNGGKNSEDFLRLPDVKRVLNI